MLGTKHGHLGITIHVAPEQAQFESEYFLALTEDSPPLFNLIGQCFQDVGFRLVFILCGTVYPKSCRILRST
jgi:hypothetical protein